MSVMIKFQQVSHCYTTSQGECEALRQVSMEIEQGRFVAIVGANGSGKSTLAKHMNAILLPCEGTVTVDGMDTADSQYLWDIRQQVGMVFQNPDNQIVAAVVEEDVAFGPENLGMEPTLIRQRVDEALELTGMSEYRLHAPHLLSGGQKQRIAIAGVIAMRPKCLVLDEPTAMLDPVGRREVMETIQHLNRSEGLTIVLITHFMEEAAQADRIIVMNQGQIAVDGDSQTVFQHGEDLGRFGLDLPVYMKLAAALRKKGVPVPEHIRTAQELAVALCR